MIQLLLTLIVTAWIPIDAGWEPVDIYEIPPWDNEIDLGHQCLPDKAGCAPSQSSFDRKVIFIRDFAMSPGDPSYWAQFECNIIWHELAHVKGLSHAEMKFTPDCWNNTEPLLH